MSLAALHRLLPRATGLAVLVTAGRSQEKRERNVTIRYIDHFYSLAVESGFYGDAAY